MVSFSLGSELTSGEGALDKLTELGIKRAVVVCDPFMTKSGASKYVTDRLDAAGARWDIFDGVVPDPTVDVVACAVGAIKSAAPDTVIALGGGSAIDTAKAANFIYAQGEGVDQPQLVVVPTTSGTGSEATSFSVISDPSAGVKYPLVSDDLLPNHAILDPSLTLTVPPVVTADTGLDVLTHAIEAYVATGHTDMTDAFAEKAAAIVFEYLETAVKDGSNFEARERLQNASCMAGVAFNNAGLGLNHAMAHALGAQLHMSHGRCNALLLPHVIRFNAEGGLTRARYAKLAARVGCNCHNEQIAVESLVRKIETLMRACGVPARVEDPEKRELLTQHAADMAANAQKDRCMPTNPRVATDAQIVEVYNKIA